MSNQPLFPPSGAQAIPPDLDAILTAKFQEVERRYAGELASRDEMLSRFQTELQNRENAYKQYQAEVQEREEAVKQYQIEVQAREAALRGQIDELSHRLAAAANVQSQRNSGPASDSMMGDSVFDSPEPATPPRKKTPTARKSAQPTSPESTPSRTLRSSSRRATAAQEPTASTLTRSPPQPPKVATRGPKAAGTPRTFSGPKKATKPATHLYRLLRTDIPEDALNVKKAMALHIRILWGLSDSQEIPRRPDAAVVRAFMSRFSTDEDIYAMADGPDLVPRSLVQIGTSILTTSRSRTAGLIRQVEEHILNFVQARLAKLGFMSWCPDLEQTPYSLYNSACRYVAVETFTQGLVSQVVSQGYAHLQPNTAYAQNWDFLVKLYDHIVHFQIYQRYKQEARNAGSVKAADMAAPQYRARQRLAESRLAFLVENGYPKRYQKLINTKATSDDEADPDQPNIYNIKRRPERSAKAEAFIRMLDERRREVALMEHRRFRERVRRIPENQKLSAFPALPQGMPADYFDPTFFNRLQPRLRSQVAIQQVAFLPDISQSFTMCPDERLGDEAFTKKYGDEVLKDYHFIGAFETGGQDEEDDWINDDEDDMGDFEEDEQDNADFGEMIDEDVPMKRSGLVAQLSLQQL